MQMNSEKLLIVGCGDLGQRLARELVGTHYTVTGVRRTPPSTSSPGLALRHCDVTDPAAFAEVIAEGYAVVVITMTPGERSDAGYRRAYVETCQHLVESLQAQKQTPRLLLFVSSTGVYGEEDGSWVDEKTPAQPTGFSGQRLLEAETVIRHSGFAHCIVRFSGIYGPGRNRLLEQVRTGRASLSAAYTNRIHTDDCAGVLAHLLERHRQGQTLAPVYIASDCAPVPMSEVVEWLAGQIQVPLTPSVTQLQTNARETPGAFVRGNKRCNNQHLLETGYRFRYPDYRAGYSALLAES